MRIRFIALFLVFSSVAMAPTAHAALALPGVSVNSFGHDSDFIVVPQPLSNAGSLSISRVSDTSQWETITNADVSTPNGPGVGSAVFVGGANPKQNQIDTSLAGTAIATSTSIFRVFGPAATPLDVDVHAILNGSLTVFGRPVDMGRVTYGITAQTETSGPNPAFNGTATLAGIALTSSGDLNNADFVIAGQAASINLDRTVQNVLTVHNGDLISITASLETYAFVTGAFEKNASSDFAHTGQFALASNTAGVTFVQVVPEPASLAMLLLAVPVCLSRNRRSRS